MFEHFSNKRRIEQLEEDFGKLRREFSALQLEWLSTLDKLKSVMGRMVKREALSQEKEDLLMGTPPEPANGQLSTLSPRQRIIQAQIEARRERLKGGA